MMFNHQIMKLKVKKKAPFNPFKSRNVPEYNVRMSNVEKVPYRERSNTENFDSPICKRHRKVQNGNFSQMTIVMNQQQSISVLSSDPNCSQA